MPAETMDTPALLHDVAALVPGWRSMAVDFDALPGGRTNQNFVAKVNGSRYVVRIAVPDARELGIRRDDEFAAWQAASDAGIAPKVLWRDDDRRVLVSEFVRGRHWSPGDIQHGDNLARLTEALRTTHALAVNASPFDAVSLGCAFESRCAAGTLPPKVKGGWRTHVCAIARYGANRPESRLCHNDLGRGNFIDDGTQLWLIDWECAGVGDPYYDLAIVAHNNRFTSEQETELVQAYAGQLLPGDLERLARMKVAHDFYHVFWYASQLPVTSTPDDFRRGCEFHADRLDGELRAFGEDGSYRPAAARRQA
jgi:thiamine kinase-like enzyme